MAAIARENRSPKLDQSPYIDATRKRFATLQAAAALRGIAVSRTTTDASREAFLVSRWALTRELANIDELERFLDLQGVRA